MSAILNKSGAVGAAAQTTKYSQKQCVAIKGIIQLLISVLAIIMLLFCGMVTYLDGAVNFSLSGLNLITALFFGGELKYNLYGNVILVHIPMYVFAFFLIALISAIALAVTYVILNIVKKRDVRFIGWFQIAAGALTILFYILLLTVSAFGATSYSGEEKIFYQLFEISILFPLVGALLLLVGMLQLKFKVSAIPVMMKYWVFYALLALPILLILVFNVYPIILQLILAFKEYTLAQGVWGSAWTGNNFKMLFTDSTILMVIGRTVYLSLLRIVAGIVPAVLFALLLFHITKKKYRSVIQTIVYIPHFFSWVVIYAILSAFMTPDGAINIILVKMGRSPIDFLSNPVLFYPNMILSSIWKEVGWGTILYMAALMAIDKELYNAAAIDGAGVFSKLRHITFPGMTSILVFQIIMAVGGVLRGAGGEQILIFATSSVRENKALVIDTWLYWQGLGELKYGLSSAISFAQSIIGFALVIGTHKLSQRLVGIGAW